MNRPHGQLYDINRTKPKRASQKCGQGGRHHHSRIAFSLVFSPTVLNLFKIRLGFEEL